MSMVMSSGQVRYIPRFSDVLPALSQMMQRDAQTMTVRLDIRKKYTNLRSPSYSPIYIR